MAPEDVFVKAALHAAHELMARGSGPIGAMIDAQACIFARVFALVLFLKDKVPPVDKVVHKVVNDGSVERQANIGPAHAGVLGAVD